MKKQTQISTAGQLFNDGSAIELIGSSKAMASVSLLYARGSQRKIVPRLEHGGCVYVPADIEPTLLGALRIPAAWAPYGCARDLVAEISKLVSSYAGLSDSATILVTRFVLASCLIDHIDTAPWFSVVGRNPLAANQLLQMLAALCRRALTVAEVDFSSMCALSEGLRLTWLVRQPVLSSGLGRMLNAARKSDGYILHRGRIIHPFGAIATFSEVAPELAHSMLPGLEIPVIPAVTQLPILDRESQERIACDFQPKLLAYLMTNANKVKTARTIIDLREPPGSLRDVAISLAACTPNDEDLQYELLRALQLQHTSMRPSRWTDIDVVLIEALLFYCHEGKQDCVYVGEVGKTAENILSARGEALRLQPKNVAAKMRLLGVKIEPRDKRGYRVLLTQAVSRQLHALAKSVDAPSVQDGEMRCSQCELIVSEQRADTDRFKSVRNERNVQNVQNARSPLGPSRLAAKHLHQHPGEDKK